MNIPPESIHVPNLQRMMPWHQATKRFTRRQVEGFVQFLATWMTKHAGFPADAVATQTTPNTWTIAVTMHEAPAADA